MGVFEHKYIRSQKQIKIRCAWCDLVILCLKCDGSWDQAGDCSTPQNPPKQFQSTACAIMFCSQKLGCLPLEQETNGWERQIKPVRLTSETLLGFSRAKMLQIPPPKKELRMVQSPHKHSQTISINPFSQIIQAILHHVHQLTHVYQP